MLGTSGLVLPAAGPAEVNMLIPGFTVEEVPVKLPNVNNLRFAPDGSLTALGYNGKVWKLRDTDGDGLEDDASVWWDKAPLTVPVGMTWSTHGLFVSSSGKVSLLKDTDRDGVADTEEVVASGWTEKDVASGNVDATGVTMDGEGNLYFGLLTANYANAYRLKKLKELTAGEREWLMARGKVIPTDPEEEVSLYDLNGQRGSVQKWNARTRQLETIATGVRVPYQFAFNQAGDLFMTDQEGETWMPNGNPLDELNHIVPGRHYGFPPPHEKWLPDLVSEPPVVGFGPQHQSTCGFVFNEPREAINTVGRGSRRAPAQSGGQGSAGASPYQGDARPALPAQGLFGPKWWEGDAIVTGESRGKLWRVRLVKTDHGYVGKEFLIARLSMLTADVAISPKGDLYVSCHSGLPDWGTGPNGEGKIFRIRYTDREAPQPVLAWSSTQDEVSVAFDRPIPGAMTNAVVTVKAGANVSPASQLEVMKPPYRAVMELEAQPHRELTTQGVRLGDDPSVLVISVAALNLPTRHALSVGLPPELARRYSISSLHLGFDLSGVEVTGALDEHRLKLPAGKSVSVPLRGRLVWNSDLTEKSFRTIRPTTILALDAQAAKGLSRGSDYLRSLHDEVFSSSLHELTFRARYQFEAARTNLHMFSKERLFESGTEGAVAFKRSEDWMVVVANIGGEGTHEFIVSRQWSAGPVSTALSHKTGEDLRTSPPSAFLLPWVAASQTKESTVTTGLRATGDYETGRGLFFSEKLQCAACHRIRGEGAGHGPDLSNLVSRDAASVLSDITEPGASINPDYVGYSLRLRNGDELSGFVRHEGNNSLKITAATGAETVVVPTEVAEMQPAGVSLMPSGLLDGLEESQINDLLTFLLHEPPKRDQAEARRIFGVPTSRTGDVAANDGTVPSRSSALRVVLVASKQDHGPGQHDYPAWQKAWHPLLAQAENVMVEDAWLWPTEEQFAKADAIVFYYWNRAWDDAKYAHLDAFQVRGGGIVVLHSATIADTEPAKLAERIGLAAQPGTVKYRHMPFDLKFVDRAHPIMIGLPEELYFLDEPYWPMIGDRSQIRILASAANVDGEDRPMMWTFERGKGRVFASIAGHYTWTLDDPVFRTIILRGLDWVTHGDRFVKAFAD